MDDTKELCVFFSNVMSEYLTSEKKDDPRDIFFKLLFCFDSCLIGKCDELGTDEIGITQDLLNMHPKWKLKDNQLIFVVRSNAFDDQDVLTIRARILPRKAKQCYVHSSIFQLCSTGRNEDNTIGKCKIYIPRFISISPKAKTIAKYLYNEDWYYGQISDNQYHGLGVYHCSSQGTYIGEFNNNKQHGIGYHLKPNGESNFVIYSGQFDNNKRNGLGIIRDSTGFYWKVRYEQGKCVDRQMIEQDVEFQTSYDEEENIPIINISAV